MIVFWQNCSWSIFTVKRLIIKVWKLSFQDTVHVNLVPYYKSLKFSALSYEKGMKWVLTGVYWRRPFLLWIQNETVTFTVIYLYRLLQELWFTVNWISCNCILLLSKIAKSTRSCHRRHWHSVRGYISRSVKKAVFLEYLIILCILTLSLLL